jgi:uncharacterized protein (DUF1330 family)
MEIKHIKPTAKQMQELMKFPKNTPLVMINILRFKAKTGNGDETGREAYARYFKKVNSFAIKAGVRIIWKGKVSSMVIGDSKGVPHVIFLAEYPSVDHFLGLLSNPEYQKVANGRTVALEYGGLIACATEL